MEGQEEQDWKKLVALYQEQIAELNKQLANHKKNSEHIDSWRRDRQKDLEAKIAALESGEGFAAMQKRMQVAEEKASECDAKLEMLRAKLSEERCHFTNEHDDMARRKDELYWQLKESRKATAKLVDEVNTLKRLLKLIQ